MCNCKCIKQPHTCSRILVCGGTINNDATQQENNAGAGLGTIVNAAGAGLVQLLMLLVHCLVPLLMLQVQCLGQL